MDTPFEPSPVETPAGPRPRIVQFDSTAQRYLRLLGGPPDTVTMRSGLVSLKPQESVGEHTTAANEEAIVVLEGVGELQIERQESLPLASGTIAYCPPTTTHNVTNTGTGLLRYVYVVARAWADSEDA